jgi:hypothetical protein
MLCRWLAKKSILAHRAGQRLERGNASPPTHEELSGGEEMNNHGINTSPTSLRRRFFLLVILAAFGSVSFVRAQTTSFTYQGRLTDGATAANATYDMQFKLFDTVSAGNQIGSTITNGAVLVNNGVFTVSLDYGAAAFSGADRYLEIGVRLAGDANAYTILAPRQQLTSAVYAIRAGSATNADTATNASTATNATQLGGVVANQYVQTSDARLSDARVPAPGSSNYIQNSAAVQASANFNISGNGTAGGTLSANAVNAVTQYNLGGNRVLSVAGTDNTFAGVSAGSANTSSGNSFFGRSAGVLNTTGTNNSFFGRAAGNANTKGGDNSFFGSFTGDSTTEGFANSFFGQLAGNLNVTGDRNTAIGYRAGMTSGNLVNATAIGAYAKVSQSNSLVLGSFAEFSEPGVDINVGIGTSAPNARFHIALNHGNIVMGDAGCASGAGIGFGSSLAGCTNYSLLGDGANTYINRPTGGTIVFRENNVNQMFIAPGGAVTINTLGSGGITHVCRNGSNQISDCSSSLRYKTNIQPFIGGLSVLNRLRPITFDWKQGGMHDLGFGAEEIAAIEPLLVTRNDKGEVEGVKYDRITAVLVNAIKEQQKQIEGLKKLVCQRNRRAADCK